MHSAERQTKPTEHPRPALVIGSKSNMAAVISHAGLSTIMAALTAGVPLLCIPLGTRSALQRRARRDHREDGP